MYCSATKKIAKTSNATATCVVSPDRMIEDSDSVLMAPILSGAGKLIDCKMDNCL